MTVLHNKKEVAYHLNISVSLIEKWVFFKLIPFIKIGKSVRFETEKVFNAVSDPSFQCRSKKAFDAYKSKEKKVS